MIRAIRLVPAVLSFVALAASAFAQSSHTGAIVVTLIDSPDAAAKDAMVTIANLDIGITREVTPDKKGSITVTNLPVTGAYTVSVRRFGSMSDDKAAVMADDVTGVELRVGETTEITIKLSKAEHQSQATIVGGNERIRQTAEAGTYLDAERISETPMLGRQLTALPLVDSAFRQGKGAGEQFLNATSFVAGAGGRKQPSYVVDGGGANEPRGHETMFLMLPYMSVEEVGLLTHPVSAEYGWTSGPVINLVTKAGGNSYHGDMLQLFRPGRLQSAAMDGAICPAAITSCVPTTISGAPLAIRAPDVPDRLYHSSLSSGGPIAEDQTFYFAAFDFGSGQRTAPITSLLVPPASKVVSDTQQLLFSLRLDHRLSDTHMVAGRFNVDRQSDTNPADVASQSVLEGAGMAFRRRGVGGQVTDTTIRSLRTVNELRVSYQQADPQSDLVPTTPSVQYLRLGPVPFTSGESRNVLAVSRQTEIGDTVTWTRGQHILSFGGSAAFATATANDTEFGKDFSYGQFIINPQSVVTLDDLTLSDALIYHQGYSLGVTSATVQQWFVTGFVQDSFRARSNLTLDLGLRYDRQTSVDASGTIGPRFGLAWSPTKDGRTLVRAAYGMYYSMVTASDLASFTLFGPSGQLVYTATPGQPGFPTSLGTVPVTIDTTSTSTLPARDVMIRPGDRALYASQIAGFDQIPDCAGAATTLCYPSSLVNPRSQVISAGIERRLSPRLSVSASYLYQHTAGVLATVDLNAPSYFARTAPGQVRSAAAADLTRPIVPVMGGFRSISVIENGGVADYNGITASLTFRTPSKFSATVSYTLSSATNTAEPDGFGVGANDQNRLGETERGPSLSDQRHRAVLSATFVPFRNIAIGTVTYLASGLPVNAITGVDNNGDGLLNDRPVVGGQVIGRSGFRGSPTAEVAAFLEKSFRFPSGMFVLRGEAINLFNHANIIGRNTVYGDAATPLASFGQAGTGIANLDRGRTFQFVIRLVF